MRNWDYWQYMFVNLGPNGGHLETFNELGRDGWELVQIHVHILGGTAYFKRHFSKEDYEYRNCPELSGRDCSCKGYDDEPTCKVHGIGCPPSAVDARTHWSPEQVKKDVELRSQELIRGLNENQAKQG